MVVGVLSGGSSIVRVRWGVGNGDSIAGPEYDADVGGDMLLRGCLHRPNLYRLTMAESETISGEEVHRIYLR